MSKAEKRALEAYPITMSQYSDNCKEYDSNESDRLTFIEGYHQAEKELELTWKDMAEIVKIANLLEIEYLNSTPWDGIRDCGFYKEVLKRFKEKKEK